VVTDQHQPYIKAVATTCPGAVHIRTGLHGARGEPPKPSSAATCPPRSTEKQSWPEAHQVGAAVPGGLRSGAPPAARRSTWCRPPGKWLSSTCPRVDRRCGDPSTGTPSASTGLNPSTILTTRDRVSSLT
jgi:hypothetical protein